MNEFEYEVLQRKRLAGQARHRKGGSKSKKCPLSTDYMTPKQWAERCGEVVSFQIGKPMKWAEFCELPRDLKEEYLKNLIEKYSVSARVLATMFGVTPVTVFRMVEKEKLDIEFSKGRRMSYEQKVDFDRFLADDLSIEETPTMNDVECQDEPENSVNIEEPVTCEYERSEPKTKLDGFTMNFSGQIDVDMIANSLRYILGSGSNARVQIICELA